MTAGTMDEWMLNDVLECSVCLEQLDSTSKVLPCQHTFCKRCLEEIVCSRKELRCPECRVLVETKVDELPCNILLIRILEGMKNAPRMKSLGCVGGVGGSGLGVSFATAELTRSGRPQPPVPLQHSPVSPHSAALRPGITDNYAPTPLKQLSSQIQPCARALYAYEAKEPGDLSFKKGDVIILRKKIDLNWFSGELAGKCGFFPASYVQVMTPLPTHSPQCKALYDFRMNDNDEKDCLSFSKGEVITVIRRVDENWIEGKLGERIGIFPISFVEMNGAGRSLMKLSTNIHSGPSRVAPPTPSSDSDTTPLITSANSGSRIAGRPCVSSSTSSSSTSSSTTTSSSSSSSTTPSPSSPPASALPSSHPSPVQRQLLHHHQQQQKLHLELLQHQQRDKRHSVVAGGSGNATPGSAPTTSLSSTSGQSRPTPPLPSSSSSSSSSQHHRHPSLVTATELVIANSQTVLSMHGQSSSSLSPPPPPAGRKVPPLPPPAVVSLIPTAVAHSTTRLKHNLKMQVGNAHQEGVACSSTPNLPLTTSGNQSLIHVAVPIFYVALYPYKPQKEDELELRKTELYTVSEKCQDGWFKGTSLRTGHCGVFPGNYVQAAKSQGVPELPPRVVIAHPPPDSPAASPSATTTTTTGLLVSPPAISQSWHGTPSTPQQHSPSPPTPMSRSLLSAATAVTPPNVSVGSSPSSSAGPAAPSSSGQLQQDKCAKINKKKQKTPDSKVSFVKMLSIKKKNPKTPSPSAYSMDNPVFVDCPSSHSSNNSPATSSPTVTHARSESCPSDAVLSVNAPQGGHRKSNSIDGSTDNGNVNAGNGQVPRPKQPAPLVRERFRCIVPYPPNSEYELELKVGDIIYVHRKREDGWYKGTLHRTGKTGLFPGSFVESF